MDNQSPTGRPGEDNGGQIADESATGDSDTGMTLPRDNRDGPSIASYVQGIKAKLTEELLFDDFIEKSEFRYEEKSLGISKLELHRSPLKKLTVGRCAESTLPSNPTGFASSSGTGECFAALTMFGERGPFSGHVYQPNVNHRQMNFDSFNDTIERDGVSHPKLIDSMVCPDASHNFSAGNHMSFCPYEMVEEMDEGKLPRIESPAALLVEPPNHGDGVYGIAGSIKGYRARQLTPETWARTLELFGLKRADKFAKTAPPESSEIAHFLQILCEVKGICTVEGLKAFISKFSLEWLYSSNEDPIEGQLFVLFSLVRSLTGFRLAAYDGRHRFNLCCYIASGHNHPTRTLALKRSLFSAAFPKAGGLGKCAVFQKQHFIISVPPKNMEDAMCLEKLRESGMNTTAGQNLYIEANWNTIITQFVEEKMIGGGLINELEECNFQNYWHPALNEMRVVARNYEIVCEALKKFVEASVTTRGPLVIGRTGYPLESIFKRSSPKVNKQLNSALGRLRDGQAPTGVPQNWQVVLSVMKFLCNKGKNVMKLRQFLEFSELGCRCPQGPINPDHQRIFRSIDGLRYYLFGVSTLATNTVMERYSLEKGIFKYLKTAENNEHLKLDVKSENFHELEACRENGFFTAMKALIEKEKKGISDKTFSITDESPVNQKLQFACQAVLFDDILEAVTLYGLNPIIEKNGEINAVFAFYLDGDDLVPVANIVRFGTTPPPSLDLERNTIPALFEVYLDWLVTAIDLKNLKPFALIHFCPEAEEVNIGVKKCNSGFMKTGKLPSCHASTCTSLDACVPEEYKFSFFVDGVRSGRINVDEKCPRFKKHMEPYLAKQWEKHDAAVKDKDGNPNFEMPKSRPLAQRPPKKGKGKSGGKKGLHDFKKLLKYAFLSEDAKEKLPESQKLDPDQIADCKFESLGLSKSFEELHKLQAIDQVIFNNEKIDELYTSDLLPSMAVLNVLCQATEGTLDRKKAAQKEKKKSKKGRDKGGGKRAAADKSGDESVARKKSRSDSGTDSLEQGSDEVSDDVSASPRSADSDKESPAEHPPEK